MSEMLRPDPEQLLPALGAMLFASDGPVELEELALALGGLAVEEVRRAVTDLEQHYERNGAGVSVEWVAGGVRLATRPEQAAWVRQLLRQRNRTRLSPAALETLSIVAYRQPVTAPEIQAIRGRDPAAALKTLVDRKLVRTLGHKKVVGSPLLYGTTKQFLEHFGLESLADLPSIEEFDALIGGVFAEGRAEATELATAGEGGPEPAAELGPDDDPQLEVPLADA